MRSPSYLVESCCRRRPAAGSPFPRHHEVALLSRGVLLPKETGSGQPISQTWFEALLKELTEKFGGATSFIRAPGQGLWESGGDMERDNIAVIDIMTEGLDPEFWRYLRGRLERELSQEEIVVRAQEISQL